MADLLAAAMALMFICVALMICVAALSWIGYMVREVWRALR